MIKTGYHFVGATLRDGRPVPPDGEWLVHDGAISPCVSGLHMSEHPFDAMKYAPGATLCRVELTGDLVPHGDPIDKWVGRRRRILSRIDATALLRRFACDQALSVAHLWYMPDAVRRYLETQDESLRDAARSAAWYAARDAARDAAWDAAWYAARDAAWYAARDAAWYAASAAARYAASAAARYAARSVAVDAAWYAARGDFACMVEDAFSVATITTRARP